jgi:FtsH-binding integral membrane protein
VYLFNLCVASILSSRFTSSALVWFYNVLTYLVFHLLISLSTMFICRSLWIQWLFMYQGAFRMDRSLGLKALKDYDV